jgi:microtubule-associated protein-like 6
VYFNNEGSVVYNAAALGVILDPEDNTQKFFGGYETADRRRQNLNNEDGHSDDVLALSVSTDRTIAVSGQNGPSPTIFAWSTSDGSMI